METILGRLSGREKGLLLGCLAVLVSALWYTYVLDPMIDRWKAVKTEVARQELQYQKYARIAAREGATEQEYEQSVDRLRMKSSEEEEMALLLREIEEIARDKVGITNIKPHSVKDAGFYKRFNVEIECEAKVESLVRFIYEAEKSESLLRIRRLRLQVKSGEPSLLEASLLVSKISII